MLPFQGSSKGLLYSLGYLFDSTDLSWIRMGSMLVINAFKELDRVALDFTLHLAQHHFMFSSWTCIVSCHVLHHPYNVGLCHLWFWWLLHINLGSCPSSSGRYPVYMWVWMEDVQSQISLELSMLRVVRRDHS